MTLWLIVSMSQVLEDIVELTSEQLHGAWTRPGLIILHGCLGSITGAAFVVHGASRQKTRRGSFWPFILALCEGAIPSICDS
jgi:hypothetical protein